MSWLGAPRKPLGVFGLRWLLVVAVTILPGVALAPAFRRALGGRTGLAALLAATLSPLVVSAEFFALRSAGVPVGPTVWIVVAVGLVTGLWGLWTMRAALPAGVRAAAPVLVATLPGLVLMARVFVDPQVRANQGHVYMHADLVQAFLAGAIWPEEPILAGLKCGYPFFPYPFQSVVAWVLGQTPVLSYIWPNFVAFLLLLGIADRLLAELGVGPRARVLGGLWLCFGINPHGYALAHYLPPALLDLDVWGDGRYSFWMMKYLQGTHMPLCYPPLLGILAVGVLPAPELRRRSAFVVLLTLGLAAGLMYPVLYGVAAAAIGLVGVVLFWERRRDGLAAALRDPLVLAAGGVLVSAVLLAYFAALGVDKERGAIRVTPPGQIVRKAIEAAFVAAPMLVTVVLHRRRGWSLSTSQTFVLLGTAAASTMAYLVVWLPSYRNEYKFVYGLGMGLFVFLPLVADRALARASLAKAAGGLLLAAGLVLFPVGLQFSIKTELDPTVLPPLAQDELPTRATADPEFGRAEAFEAIRTRTPKDGVLVAGWLEHYAPTYTQRSLLVPPTGLPRLAGYNWPLIAQMGTRGYPWAILKRREAAVNAFFGETVDPASLDEFTSLGRAAVLLVDRARFPATEAWLRASGRGGAVYENDKVLVWQIDP